MARSDTGPTSRWEQLLPVAILRLQSWPGHALWFASLADECQGLFTDPSDIAPAPTHRSVDAGAVCEVRRLSAKATIRRRPLTRPVCTKAKAVSMQSCQRGRSCCLPGMARAPAPGRADRTPAQSAVQHCSHFLR